MKVFRFFVLMGLLFVVGCSPKEEQSRYRLYDKAGSVRDAVIFTGVPEDKIDKYVECISHSARFPNKSELRFIRKILDVTSIEDYEQLLCRESLEQISNSKGAGITHMNTKAAIEKGTWPIKAPAGAKVVAVINDFTDLNTKSVEFALRPSHTVIFWYYHKGKGNGGMLGAAEYLIERNGEISLVPAAYSEHGARAWQMHKDLERLYTILESYAKANEGKLPDSLNELDGKLETDVLRRLIANVVYKGAGKILNTQSDEVIAYDRYTSEEGKKFALRSDGGFSYKVLDE